MVARARLIPLMFVLLIAACSGSGGGNGATPADNSACAQEPCDREENDPPQSPLVCAGFAGAACPQGYHCVDDAADTCDPATGADCGGICVVGTALPSCGGFADSGCGDGYACVDDPNDACEGGPAVDCPGVCVRQEEPRECTSSDDCPQIDAMCSVCADGKLSCPLTRCDDGKCVIAVESCPPAPFCGGIAGFFCAEGFTCVDDPNDDCDPERGGADCGGICVPSSEPVTCGGFTGQTCPPGFGCVDDPSDDCDPDESGADCPGLCEPRSEECTTDADCPQLRAPCPVCPNGTSACPSSICERGVCTVNFPTCPPPVTCGDDAEPCKPGTVCVDDPNDDCDPVSAEAPCLGICVEEQSPRPCGGPAGDTCPPGYECFYDTPDGCMPDPTFTDCGGICQPIDVPQCTSDDECPRILAPCTECPDGSFACPTAFCRDGVCGAAFESCSGSVFCGGIAGFACAEGFTCIDDPMDDCDPQRGGADCGGICVREEKPRSCGGITRDVCPAGYECADVEGDDCDPSNGADCPGFCRPADMLGCRDDSECPQVGAPCQLCADGTAACPKSFCADGQCHVVIETCAVED